MSTRIEKLKSRLQPLGLEGVLITHPIDLYYFTGLSLSAGTLWVARESQGLVVDGRYLEFCRASSTLPAYLAKDHSPLDFVSERVGVDSETMSAHTYLAFEKEALKRECTLTPVAGLTKQIRAVKEPEEISVIKKAADMACELMGFAISSLKEGLSEEQLAKIVEIHLLEKGGDAYAFDPIIAFGANAAWPHHRSSQTIWSQGQPVLIDLGVRYKKYHSDMTRTFLFSPIDKEIEKIFFVVEEALLQALRLLKPGVTTEALDKAARLPMEQAGYDAYFTHSLGHGIGLEVHENPFLRSKNGAEGVLEKGMVITIEPGIYLPGKGGVRLEEMALITDSGYEILTPYPRHKPC